MDDKPRVNALKTAGSGARVFFENSTACSKVSAMFVNIPWLVTFGLRVGVPLVNDWFFGAGFCWDFLWSTFRFGGWFWTLMESLILAQDERWRRA